MQTSWHIARSSMRVFGAIVTASTLLTGCVSFHSGPMPGEPVGATFADVEGARVRYIDAGRKDGPAVVLLHGFGAALETWSGLLPELAKTHRVIALDLKGFGWTDRPEGDYSPAAHAKLVLALMDARGVERASLVGHSWGSSVALAMALSAPARVERLVLYDAYVYEEQVPAFFAWSRASGLGEALFRLHYKERVDERVSLAFYDKKLVTQELVDDVVRGLDRPGTVAAALACARGQRYAELQKRWPEVSHPTLLVWGREDAVTPLRFGRRLSRELPRAKLEVVPKCGHFPMLEAAAESNRLTIDFLSENRSASR